MKKLEKRQIAVYYKPFYIHRMWQLFNFNGNMFQCFLNQYTGNSDHCRKASIK